MVEILAPIALFKVSLSAAAKSAKGTTVCSLTSQTYALQWDSHRIIDQTTTRTYLKHEADVKVLVPTSMSAAKAKTAIGKTTVLLNLCTLSRVELHPSLKIFGGHGCDSVKI